MKKLSEDLVKRAVSLYVDDGLQAKEVAQILGIGFCSVLRYVRRSGQSVRKQREVIKGRILTKKVSDDEVVKLYAQGKSSHQIAEALGCSNVTILNSLRRTGTSIRTNSFYLQTKFDETAAQKLYQDGKTIAQVSEIMNVPTHVLQPFLSKNGVIRPKGWSSIGRKWSKSSSLKAGYTKRLRKEQGLYDHIYLKRTGYTHAQYMEQLGLWQAYSKVVRSITNQQPLDTLENYDKRGKAGLEGAYHIDHKFSVIEGFKQGVDPSIIGHISNLHMIPWEVNAVKKGECWITLHELKSLHASSMA